MGFEACEGVIADFHEQYLYFIQKLRVIFQLNQIENGAEYFFPNHGQNKPKMQLLLSGCIFDLEQVADEHE